MNEEFCPVEGCTRKTRHENRHIWTDGAPEMYRLCEKHDKLYWRLIVSGLQPTLAMLANPPGRDSDETT
jgi:hypothetical protein